MLTPAAQAGTVVPSLSKAVTSGRLALSSDGTKLFAVNTPNNTLVIYNVTPVRHLQECRSVQAWSQSPSPSATAMKCGW